MNVNVTTVNKHVSNIDFVDIDVISEEEAQDLYPNRKPKYRIEPSELTLEGPFRGFFVIAVLTFTGGDLPVGSIFYLPGQSQQWTVHKKNMAYYNPVYLFKEKSGLRCIRVNNKKLKNYDELAQELKSWFQKIKDATDEDRLSVK